MRVRLVPFARRPRLSALAIAALLAVGPPACSDGSGSPEELCSEADAEPTSDDAVDTALDIPGLPDTTVDPDALDEDPLVCPDVAECIEPAVYTLSPPDATVILGGTIDFHLLDEDGDPVDRDDIVYSIAQQGDSPFALALIDNQGHFVAPQGMPNPPFVDVFALVLGEPPSVASAQVGFIEGDVVDVGVDLPWPNTMLDLDIDPLDPDHLFAVIDTPDSPGIMYETTDRGLSWEPRTEDWNIGIMQVAFGGSEAPDAARVYVLRWNDSIFGSFLRSEDSGTSFVRADGNGGADQLPPPVPELPDACNLYAYWPQAFGVHPADANTLYLAGNCCVPVTQRPPPPNAPDDFIWMRTCLFATANGGANWVETDPAAQAFDFSEAGGYYTYDDQGMVEGRTNWQGEKVLPWMTVSQVEVVMDGSDALILLSTQGNGLMLSRDGGVNFDWILKNEISQVINGFVAFPDPSGGIALCDWCSDEGDDPIGIGILAATSSHSINRAECFCPGSEAGFGSNFDALNDPPDAPFIEINWRFLGIAEGLYDITFHSIARHPDPPAGEEWVYVGGDLSGIIQRTDDHGDTWENAIDQLFGIPISTIAISAERPPTIFAGTVGRGGILRYAPSID